MKMNYVFLSKSTEQLPQVVGERKQQTNKKIECISRTTFGNQFLFDMVVVKYLVNRIESLIFHSKQFNSTMLTNFIYYILFH